MFLRQVVQLSPVRLQVVKLPGPAVDGDEFPLALPDGPIALALPVNCFGLDVIIQEIFEHLLTAALKLRLAIFEDVSLKLFESGLSAFDLGAKLLIPAAVALVDSVLESLVFDHLSGVLQSPGENIHRAYMTVEEIDRIY